MSIITFPVLLRSIKRRLNLSFVKEELLWNKLIGLDAIKRKLLLLKKSNENTSCSIIDLKDVTGCSVKKIYQSIAAGSLENQQPEDFINSISLQLAFKDKEEPLSITFYDRQFNVEEAVNAWESKARAWEKTVSGLLIRA